jgi:hypothetical protein
VTGTTTAIAGMANTTTTAGTMGMTTTTTMAGTAAEVPPGSTSMVSAAGVPCFTTKDFWSGVFFEDLFQPATQIFFIYMLEVAQTCWL